MYVPWQSNTTFLRVRLQSYMHFYVALYASMHLGVTGPQTKNISYGSPPCVQSMSHTTHHSFHGLSCDRFICSSKARSPQNEILCYFFQFRVPSRLCKVIQQLPTPFPSYSRHLQTICTSEMQVAYTYKQRNWVRISSSPFTLPYRLENKTRLRIKNSSSALSSQYRK